MVPPRYQEPSLPSPNALVNLGIIGAGLAVRGLHVPVLARRRHEVRVVAVTSRTAERAEALRVELEAQGFGWVARHSSVEELVEDESVDAVLVSVPIALTASLTEKALRAGKHVLAEKPLADSLAQAHALREAARDESVVLAVAENFRFRPDLHRLRDVVASGRIGKPLVYFLNDLHFTRPDGKYASTQWRREGKHRGGYLLDGGVHAIAGMRTVVNGRLQSLHALTTSFHSEYLSRQPDTLLVNLRFEEGFIGHLALGWGAVDLESRHPRIYGEAGTLVLKPRSIELWPVTGHPEVEPRSDDGGFDGEWSAFLAGVRGERAWEPLLAEAILDLAVILASCDSAERDAVVTFDDFLAREGFQSDV
jgi:predicted dehydrogenase